MIKKAIEVCIKSWVAQFGFLYFRPMLLAVTWSSCWVASLECRLFPALFMATRRSTVLTAPIQRARYGTARWSARVDTRVLARPKTTGRSALSFYSAPCRFSSAPCRFFSTLSFCESPLVSLGFHQRYFELEVAESVQLRRKVARFLCITLFASDIAAILDLRWIIIYAN